MIVLPGCEGFVGSMLTEVLRSSGSTYLGTSRSKIDYTNGLILRDFLLANDVKILINAFSVTQASPTWMLVNYQVRMFPR